MTFLVFVSLENVAVDISSTRSERRLQTSDFFLKASNRSLSLALFLEEKEEEGSNETFGDLQPSRQRQRQ